MIHRNEKIESLKMKLKKNSRKDSNRKRGEKNRMEKIINLEVQSEV